MADSKSLLLLFFLISVETTFAQWIERKPLNTVRQEMPASRHERNIYVCGGISLIGITLADMEVYNIDTDKWSAARSMPGPRHHHAMAIWDGKLYVIGGYNDVLFKPQNNLFIYQISTNTWTSGTPLPIRLGAGAAEAFNGRIYFFGGTNGEAVSNAVHIYDIATDSWTQGEDMPTPREHLSAALLDGKIYVVSGRGYAGADRALEAYDPVANTWEIKASLPTPRSGGGAVAVNGKIYMIGGEGGGGIFEELEVYDPMTDIWEALPPMPSARHGIGIAASGDTIFTIGGADKPNYSPSKKHEAYILPGVSSIISKGTVFKDLSASYRASDQSIYGQFSALITTPVVIGLSTVDGRLIHQQHMLAERGNNIIQLPLNHAINGIYILTIQNGKDVSSRKIQVVH